MAALCGLALANVFGQRETTTRADSSTASLTVDSPDHLRGGLMFTSNYVIAAHSTIHDARLVLAPGWWNGMTLNAEAPQASSDASNAHGVIFDYGQLNAGDTTPIWISWQVNPTTFGYRDTTVWLYDGSQLLVTLPRSVVVFP